MLAVSGVFQRLRYWGPLVLWMGVIYWASADSGSGRRGSRILGPVLRWLMPDASLATIEEVIFMVRKGAHVTEYAVLSWLAWRFFLGVRRTSHEPQPRRAAFMAWGVSVLYAASDEWHQTFVPTRVGTPWDVAIDAAGAAMGLILAAVWWRRRNRN